MAKDLSKNDPRFKPRLQPGEVGTTTKERREKILKENGLEELQKKVGEDPRTPPYYANKKKHA